MLNKKIQTFFIFIPLILTGCDYYKSNIKNQSAQIDIEAEIPGELEIKSELVDFQRIKKEILENNCINCHTGKHNNYDQYFIVKLAVNDILSRIRSNSFFNRMPKGRDPLPEHLISLFESWVEQGAPEFKPVFSESNIALNYNFEDFKALVLQPNQCLQCHTKYENYEVVVNDIDKILESIETGTMPISMESLEPKLITESEFNILTEWISSGLPEY